MSDETWKDVKGYEGLYWVSSSGKVKSKFQRLKPNVNSCGYEYVFLCNNKKRKCIRVHQIVAMSFLEKLDNKLVVNHKDGNKINNNLSNLEYVTSGANLKQAYKDGFKKPTRKFDDIHFLTRATIMNNANYSELNLYMPNSSYDYYMEGEYTKNETLMDIYKAMRNVRRKLRRRIMLK